MAQRCEGCNLRRQLPTRKIAPTDIQTSPFLNLPCELRDRILEYAVDAPYDNEPSSSPKTLNAGQWAIASQSHAPTATYLSLAQTCCKLYHEVNQLLDRMASTVEHSASLELQVSIPKAQAVWHCIPRRPEQITELDVHVRVGDLFNVKHNTMDHHDLLLQPVFETLKRYIHYGPHLPRDSPLPQPLKLDTVRISVTSLVPYEDMTHIFASPMVAIGMLYGHMRTLMVRLARSSLAAGSIGAFELRLEDREFERVPVTANPLDERDHVFFRNIGLMWRGDAEEADSTIAEGCAHCGRHLPSAT